MSFQAHGSRASGNAIQHVGPVNNSYYGTTTIDAIDRSCLRALRCPDTLVVKNGLKENKGRLLRESMDWILQDPNYASWQDGGSVCLLWIKGGAGKGKTMMSIGLIEQLSVPQDDSTVVTYFFCQNADSELNTLEAIIKGLILRLVNQQKELKECWRSHWDTGKERFYEDMTSWRTLWNMFWEMLQQCKCRRVYVIVDALDECLDDGMTDFLKKIVRTGLDQPSKIKWMLTSRPLDSADQELLASQARVVLVNLELKSDHISKAVTNYITEQVHELDCRNYYGPDLCHDIQLELTTKAEGTFLWVSLVCERLENVHRDKALTTIQDLPKGLHPFYRRILNQLSVGEPSIVERCIRLLKAMMLAYRPLNMAEVGSVSGLSDERRNVEALVNRCASFIKMRGTTDIEFVHQSARDYLAGEVGQSVLNADGCYGHGEIALSCLSHLSQRLKVNLIDLPLPDSSRESMEGNKLMSSVEYAATFWVEHLEVAQQTTLVHKALDKQGQVDKFLCTKLLEWLECLSLLDKLPLAIEALETLASIADLQKSVSLLMVLGDARRFLLRHYTTLSTRPLQIYSSGIVFSPETSIVRRKNLDKLPQWLRKLPQMEESWAGLIQTLAGHSHWVTAVAFSPDGKQIVSGSWDKTIKLWDATTGSLQKTLAGHSHRVIAVAFSPDGKQIVSGSEDKTIKLWDATTGSLQKTLAGHSHEVTAVAFSPDGKQIVSGSEDKTIKLWDATTGSLQKTLAGHSHEVIAVAFSPDSKQIVSGSWDTTIKLWDATTGSLQKTLAGHSYKVTAVAFSPDGKQIVSGSWDKTIKLWDATTGSLQTILAGHSHEVTAVAFSPDGKQIVSGSWDKTIKLWDATTDSLQKTLAGHSYGVIAVAFSPDGKQIVSGSWDKTIKLWDATTGSLQKTLAGHSHRVTAVAFSPDGKQIVSGSWDKTIKLWDATTGSLQKTLAGHSHEIIAVAFSPDGKQIVSGSWDKTIKLWDATTGSLQTILAGHSHRVTAVVFSPDGKQIVSGSWDKTIKLWDATTGSLQKTLAGHSHEIIAVAFSPDGKQIVSGSWDKTIKLWDATTGSLQKTLAGHSDGVTAVAFSPDGKQIVSGSEDKTIKLWDVTKGLHFSRFLRNKIGIRLKQEIKTLQRINSLKFSLDGRCLLTDLGPVTIQSNIQSIGLDSNDMLCVGNQWISYGTAPVFLLPSDFIVGCYDVSGDRVVIGFDNGRVLSFDIDRVSLKSILKN